MSQYIRLDWNTDVKTFYTLQEIELILGYKHGPYFLFY